MLHMLGVGSDVLYLPVFSSEKQLREVLAKGRVPFDKIKHIDDGPEFMDSIPVEVIIIKDLYFTEEGKVRYTQILR
jgi:hypothetical protein